MDNFEEEIKKFIISTIALEDLTVADIDSVTPLFKDGLGLDSIDALELGVALQKKYHIKIEGENEQVRQNFYSVKTLAEFLKKRLPEANAKE